MGHAGHVAAQPVDETEPAPDADGHIFIAAVQIAIAIGAGAGGFIFDWFGGPAVYALGGALVIAASAAVYRTTKTANIPSSARQGAQ